MKQFTAAAALSLLAFAQSVHGHGYMTFPNSRTRLGFEVHTRSNITTHPILPRNKTNPKPPLILGRRGHLP